MQGRTTTTTQMETKCIVIKRISGIYRQELHDRTGSSGKYCFLDIFLCSMNVNKSGHLEMLAALFIVMKKHFVNFFVC